MNESHWEKVKRLFSAAAELPREERAGWLARESGGDAALIAEVQSLLDAHEQPGAFLDTVTHELRAQAFGIQSTALNRIGARIGAYRVVGVLGTGGMGDVFKAVRDDDQYQAEVAIKLMRADMRSTLTEQRFRTERQILAGLDHRNIARLLDGGTTGEGTPYLVMELVKGEPIDGYSEARDLGVRERVQIFLQVCAAVSYAHQHLVVHRDLKPNNILVTADGSVKLLDFGIAKLLEAEAPTVEAGIGTVTTMRAMTLEYASPEQVAGGTVTTVSDVYSLGVVLYRLLTGKSPYGVQINDAERMAQILGDTTPTRPSQWQRRLDSDLDNILLMALRKEPQRRYGSVEQFANDLRNYLAGMPVKARGNSLRYRAGKFVRRRKIEIAAAALVAAVLLGAVVFSTREARIAEREREVAQEHFDSVRKLANTLLFDIHDEVAKVPGSTAAREKLVSTSLEYLDALYKRAGSDPRLQEELATAYTKVAEIQGDDGAANKGNLQDAMRSYDRSIALFTPLAAADPSNHRPGWSLAYAYVGRASLLLMTRGPKEALEDVEKGVALSEQHAAGAADEAERVFRMGNAYVVHARILNFLGRSPEAMASVDKYIAQREANLRANPDDERAMKSLSIAYNNSSLIADRRLTEVQQQQRALDLLNKSLRLDEKMLALRPDNPDYQRRIARSRFNIANLLLARGLYAEARDLYRMGVPAIEKAAEDTDDAEAQYTLGMYESAYAWTLFKTGDSGGARALLLKCEKLFDEQLKHDGSLRSEYAVGQNAIRLGVLHAELERPQSARDYLQRGIASIQKVENQAALEAADLLILDEGVATLARLNATSR